jgi:hypothetical protein
VVDCSRCAGTNCGNHLFLEANGMCICNACGKIMCLECTCQQENCENVFCYDCFLPEEVSVDNSQVEHTLAPNQMRVELRNLGIHTTKANEDDNEVGEIYDAIQGEQMLYSTSHLEKVRMPFKKGTYLTILERESLLGSISLREGGKF